MSLLQPGTTLGIFGAGIMGRAIAKALLSSAVVRPEQLWATAKTQASRDRIAAELGITTSPHVASADIILLGVKPGQVVEATEGLRAAGLKPSTLLISILAGVTTTRLHSLVANPWVRALPNTPSAIGAGMTAICAGPGVTDAQLAAAKSIFTAAGRCEIVAEDHLNAVTALCGCSTAYMYVILDAMSDAGVRLGVERQLALELAAQAMLGSACMVLETGRHPAALRDDVTTPGGGTIAGLRSLEDDGLRSAMARAIETAARRIDEIGREIGRAS